MSKDVTLFDRFWNDVPSVFQAGGDFDRILSGSSDFESFDDHYEISMEVPGVKKDEVGIELQGDELVVSWSRSREKKKGLGKRSRFERREGSFTRRFHVDGADQSKVTAELKNGVLTLNVPKRAEYQPTRIAIK